MAEHSSSSMNLQQVSNLREETLQNFQGSVDRYSHSDMLSLALEEVHNLTSELESLGKEFESLQQNCSRYQTRSFSKSNVTREEYTEILNKKGDTLEKLTDEIKLAKPFGIPQFRLECFEEIITMINKKCEEVKQHVHGCEEQKHKVNYDMNEMKTQITDFSTILGEENDNEDIQVKQLFEEAKADLDVVLQTVCPNDEEKSGFSSTLQSLVELYLNNLENKEAQYAEISQLKLKNKGIMCLLSGGVITQHPRHPQRFCLCMEE